MILFQKSSKFEASDISILTLSPEEQNLLNKVFQNMHHPLLKVENLKKSYGEKALSMGSPLR